MCVYGNEIPKRSATWNAHCSPYPLVQLHFDDFFSLSEKIISSNHCYTVVEAACTLDWKETFFYIFLPYCRMKMGGKKDMFQSQQRTIIQLLYTQALFLCVLFFVQMVNVHLFSRLLPHFNTTTCYEYSWGLCRLWAVSGSCNVIFKSFVLRKGYL